MLNHVNLPDTTDFQCGIRAERVNNMHIVAPFETIQALVEVLFLIEGEDNDRNFAEILQWWRSRVRAPRIQVYFSIIALVVLRIAN